MTGQEVAPVAAETIRHCLAQGIPTFSFEFFPPKTADGSQQLWQAIRELEQLRPSFVSVTYGAGGSTRDTTVAITERIASETTLLPLAHLTAVNHSIAELRQMIGRLADAGVRNVLALRGDPPGDPNGEWIRHPDGIEFAEELVRLIKVHGNYCVGVAAFPEMHPRSPDRESDVHYLVEKCRAGADFAITQMFFDVADYLRLRDAVSQRGCQVPIIAGIMPVTNFRSIQRIAELSGARVPEQLVARLAAVAEDPVAVRQIGVEYASQQCQQLLAEGVPGIHFYTLNKSTATREVWANLGLDRRSSIDSSGVSTLD